MRNGTLDQWVGGATQHLRNSNIMSGFRQLVSAGRCTVMDVNASFYIDSKQNIMANVLYSRCSTSDLFFFQCQIDLKWGTMAPRLCSSFHELADILVKPPYRSVLTQKKYIFTQTPTKKSIVFLYGDQTLEDTKIYTQFILYEHF